MRYGIELRTNTIITGAQRSGKTYFAEKYAHRYSNLVGPVLVYNPGMAKDWKDYAYLEPIPLTETAERIHAKDRNERTSKRRKVKRNAYFIEFRLNGKRYKFKDLNAVLRKHPRVKVERLSHIKLEGLFFKSLLMYFGGGLLILDDFRGVARRISAPEMAPFTELMTKINHAGKHSSTPANRGGVDIFMIFHHPDKVNTELFDYATHLLFFKIQRPAAGNQMDDEVKECYQNAYQRLKDSPRFSYCEISLVGENPFSLIYHSPEETAKL